jgi:pimeloyl-ACP methyl ester carboxylesterase/DNA-binding CsgD family transcriptional regulator
VAHSASTGALRVCSLLVSGLAHATAFLLTIVSVRQRDARQAGRVGGKSALDRLALASRAPPANSIGSVEQKIRFCSSSDGVTIAYAEHGMGPSVVKAANWLTHLEYDWRSSVWKHWLEELARGHRVVRYDERGCGLSDRDVEELSLDSFVSDLEAVVDAADLDRFILLGLSQGGAIAIAYAVRHPERVSHLIICGGYARGRQKRDLSPEQRDEATLLQSVVRVGWGRPDPVFRRVFTTRFVPGGTDEQLEWFDELQRVSVSPETAERLRACWGQIDVLDLLDAVDVPTLVAHARDDAVVPFSEGRLLASRIRGARFLSLEGRNHVLLEHEPAWPVFLAELREFIGTPELSPSASLEDLTQRELDVLELVADGLSNEEIGGRLFVSSRTVERHLSNVYAKLRLSGKAARAAAAARFSAARR